MGRPEKPYRHVTPAAYASFLRLFAQIVRKRSERNDRFLALREEGIAGLKLIKTTVKKTKRALQKDTDQLEVTKNQQRKLEVSGTL